MDSFRFGMVKLQHDIFLHEKAMIEEFPLWHGKVATHI